MSRALITGLGGQDGSYLAELLLDFNYEVHGIIRRQSTPENQSTRYEHINSKIKTHYGDLLDEHSLYRIMKEVRPTHIFNLAAMSHVRISFDVPSVLMKTTTKD
jgi:GDPmannose 4,6-dehydratase